ncbi:Disease resistance protein (TIR-NBS-LRR class) family [Euphorbia peplus]|nr:Disease resistance protein (TIR-NBS-LRR class) family [Euphorbia peplus]
MDGISCSSGYSYPYHVFLSFRADDDTANTFTDHLYAALDRAGIHTFREGFETQESINKAMLESKLCIVVFSQGYASSVHCLDQLVYIMELRRTRGLVVVPVFYDADPGQVWDQSGTYAEAFAAHEQLFKEEMYKVHQWRASLRDITDLSGMDLLGRHEAEFIQDIVEKVEKRLNRTILLHSPSYLVGIDSRIKDINLWLQSAVSDSTTSIIYGIGGIGKTTIAKIVYNQNLDKFEGGCFLADIREASKRPDTLMLLQKQLLEKLLTGKVSKIDSVDEGSMMVKDVISCIRAVIVFDDVDELDQLNKIIGSRYRLHPGSKIIITTRHEGLLRNTHEKMYRKFRVEELDPKESLELFSWHAFGQNYPIQEYKEHSEIVAKCCHGIPFALEVLGSSLSVKIADGWGNTLEKMKAIPNSRIQKSLRITYDSLQDDHDKNLFLDIVCFFVGRDKNFAAKVLNGCEYHTEVGIQNLIDRHLVEINEDNKLMMHPLFQHMGREIIRQESPENPGRRSRLWYHEDSLTVLRENIGTETIKGLTFNQCTIMEDQMHRIPCTHCAKRHYYQQLTSKFMPKRRCLGFFSWQPVENNMITSVPMSDEGALETKAFSKMRKLKVLKLNDVKLHGEYEHFPKSLIWLSWHGFPTKSIQPSMYMEKIVVLDMRYSGLKYMWNGARVLLQLKILNLSYSCDLVTTSDLSGLPNLEKLKLKGCISLSEVHESIGDLKRLVLLTLKDCKSLTKLPRTIGMLRSLEELNISGCSELYKLPIELGRMESLKVLHADGLLDSATTSRLSFLSWLSKRQGIQSLLPLSFLPHSLETLSLADCKLSDIPIDFSNLSSLKYLNLSRNSIRCLPETIHSLRKLEFLVLDHCDTLQSLPELPTSLKELSAEKCTSLETIANLPHGTRSFKLNLSGSMKLVEIQGLFKLEPITDINKEIANKLNLFNLEAVRSIKLKMSCVVTLTSRITPLQVLHECGICSIFLPGSDIPSWYSPQIKGSSISFCILTLQGRKIRGLNTSTVYTCDTTSSRLGDHHHYIKIWNESRNVKLIYSPSFYAIPEREESMGWFSHWKIGDHLEDGDQLNVSVVMSSGYEVKEFGINVVYEPEPEQEEKSEEMKENAPSSYPMESDIYRVGRDAFLLCNRAYLVDQILAEAKDLFEQ